jgi:uracil-DNA glycosylase
MGIKTKEVKFNDIKFKVDKNPILIIGQNPGRQRLNEQTFNVWEGNRSSDFLKKCLRSEINYILTNVCNYQLITDERIQEGINDIVSLVDLYKPCKIICLGNFSYQHVKKVLNNDIEITKFNHPSYIVRFNKNKETYERKLHEQFT